MKFIFDLSDITNTDLVRSTLGEWTVTEHSPRCFEVSGRQWERIDIVQLWQVIGQGGHVFVFDLQSGQERCHKKGLPLGRTRYSPRDDELDSQTLRLIELFQDRESPLEAPAQE